MNSHLPEDRNHAAHRDPTSRRPGQTITDDGETRRLRQVHHTIDAAWPGELGERVLEAISSDEAFGALAWRIDQACRRGIDPAEILAALDDDTVQWAITSADNPAAFLASRLRNRIDENSI